MSTKFERKTEEWTEERLVRDFLAVRHELMTTAPGNLITPSDDPLVFTHAPFASSSYPYRNKIGSLNSDPWARIVARGAEGLIEPNPHAPSKFREGGYACWDAAVGIPATLNRRTKIVNMRDTPIVRDTNTYWSKDVALALQDVGPTGEPGIYKRPTGEYIIDFTKIEDGWFYLELAHALAHLVGDTKETHTRLAKGAVAAKTTGHIQGIIAQIAVSLLFDLPMDIMPRSEGKFAEPDFPMVGLEVKSSSFYETPFMRVPWSNNEALRFDETLAVMSVGVFIEPHPFGFITGTLAAEPEDRWACAPTLAIVAGWECIDTITHQPLVQRHVRRKNEPVCYGMHPRDMLPPDMFWGYLQLWRQRQRALGLRDVPGSNMRRMRPQEVIYTPLFERLYMNCPPRPCLECMLLNPKTDNAPQRPPGFPPKNAKELAKPGNWAWRIYFRDIASINNIIERSVIAYESKLYGVQEAKRIRKMRLRHWKDSLRHLKEQGYVEKAKQKRRLGKPLTSWEKTAYRAYIQEKKALEAARQRNDETTTGS